MVTGLEPVTHFALRRRWSASYRASSSSIQSRSISKDFLAPSVGCPGCVVLRALAAAALAQQRIQGRYPPPGKPARTRAHQRKPAETLGTKGSNSKLRDSVDNRDRIVLYGVK